MFDLPDNQEFPTVRVEHVSEVPFQIPPEPAARPVPTQNVDSPQLKLLQEQMRQLMELNQAKQYEVRPAKKPAATMDVNPGSSFSFGSILKSLGPYLVIALLVSGAWWAGIIQIGWQKPTGPVETMAVDNKIVETISEYNAQDDFILGQQYLEAARRVRSGELETLADFEDWLEVNEKDPANPRDKNYKDLFQPILDSVNQAEGNPNLATVLESIGQGYLK